MIMSVLGSGAGNGEFLAPERGGNNDGGLLNRRLLRAASCTRLSSVARRRFAFVAQIVSRWRSGSPSQVKCNQRSIVAVRRIFFCSSSTP